MHWYYISGQPKISRILCSSPLRTSLEITCFLRRLYGEPGVDDDPAVSSVVTFRFRFGAVPWSFDILVGGCFEVDGSVWVAWVPSAITGGVSLGSDTAPGAGVWPMMRSRSSASFASCFCSFLSRSATDAWYRYSLALSSVIIGGGIGHKAIKRAIRE